MLADGLYAVRRRQAITIGESKTLHCYPYQFAEATDQWLYRMANLTNTPADDSEFHLNSPFPEKISYAERYDDISLLAYYYYTLYIPNWFDSTWQSYYSTNWSAYWASLPSYYFLQPDQMSYLMGAWSGGYAEFFFTDPGVTSGTIKSIVWRAYHKGEACAGPTYISSGYTIGAPKTNTVFRWSTFRWTGTWTWASLAYLTFSSFLYLGAGAICRYLEVQINYTDTDGNNKTITLYPAGDKRTYETSAMHLCKMVGNPLFGAYPRIWDASPWANINGVPWRRAPCMTAAISCAGPNESKHDLFTIDDDFNQALPNNKKFRITNLPSAEEAITYVKISYTARNAKAGETWPALRPFVECADGITSLAGGATSGSVQWVSNPLTGQAWTLDDLTKGFFGVQMVWNYFTVLGEIWKPGVAYTIPTYTHPTSERFRYLQTYKGDYSVIDILSLNIEIGTASSKYITNAADSEFWGTCRTFTCDLSELPPYGSTVNSVNFHYKFGGGGGTHNAPKLDASGNGKMRAYLIIGGEYYFDTEHTIGLSALSDSTIISNTWSLPTNPATGGAWTCDDLAGLKFGILFRNTKVPVMVGTKLSTDMCNLIGQIYQCELEISYNEAVTTQTVEYEKFTNRWLLSSFTGAVQSPTITPDELKIVTDTYLPLRSEIVLMKDGAMPFHGIITGIDEKPKGNYTITLKSQSLILKYRYIPDYGYASSEVSYTGDTLKIPELFSNDLPAYPFGQTVSCREPYPVNEIIGESDYYGVRRTIRYQSKLGLFWLIHSMIPPGSSVAYNSHVAKYGNLGSRMSGRYLFTTARCPVPLPDSLMIFVNATIDYENTTKIMTFNYSDHGGLMQGQPDYVGGVHRLAPVSSLAALDRGLCYRNENDLYVHTGGAPDTVLVCADMAFDTFIRPGNFELSENYINTPKVFSGNALQAISDFMVQIGQEPRFRNALDGLIYLDTASEMAQSSDPVARYTDGQNCKITVTEPGEPVFDAIVGIAGQSNNAVLSVDWSRTGTWITKYQLDSERSKAELLAYIGRLRTYDDYQYKVEVLSELWHMWPGDWITVDTERFGPKDVRLSKKVITPGRTALTAGKSIRSITDQFGQWKNALSVPGNYRKTGSYEWTFTGATGSLSKDLYVADTSKNKYVLSINISTDTGQVGQTLILQISIGGAYIQPGRIVADQDGSYEIELDSNIMGSMQSKAAVIYLRGGNAKNTVTVTYTAYELVSLIS